MKKAYKRIVSIVLALVLMVSVVSVSAYAATATTVRQYKVYASLGDSIAGGFSMPDYNAQANGQYVVGKIRVKGSYPDLLADDVLSTTFYPLAQPGFRTAEIRLMLDNSYDGDLITEKYVGELSNTTAYSLKSLKSQRKEYQTKIAKADLITLDCGFNDTWLPLEASALQIRDDLNENSTYEEILLEEAEKYGSIGAALAQGEKYLKAMLHSPKYVAIITNNIYKVFADFRTNYKAIIDRIYTLNPDVTVVAVACYNPFKDWSIAGTSLTVGDFVQPLYDEMNEYKASFVDTYGSKYKMAYVNDVEVRTTSIPSNGVSGFDPHPTEAGHKYIEKQILAVLPTGYRPLGKYPTMTKKNGTWGVYSNGKLVTSFTGIAKTSSGKMYYVKNGKWNKSFTGLVSYDSKKFYVKDGEVQTGYTGIVKTSSGSYYIRKGIAQTSFNGIATVGSKSYYIKSGKVATNFSGKVTTKSYVYTVKNGVVTSKKAR